MKIFSSRMCAKYVYFIGIFAIFGMFVKDKDTKLSVNAIPFFDCKDQNVRLLQLISFVCNNTQPAVQLRDACYGCFMRSASLSTGPPQLIGLSQCANLYLLNGTYAACAQGLAITVFGVNPTVDPISPLTCSPIYCEFVRCIRRVNAINLINLCFIANLVNRDFNRIPDRITFYTNTTACILARTRCNQINPITADIQRQKGVQIHPIGITNAVGTAGYYHHNALQIARNGEIKIIGLPSAWVLGNTFCTHNISLDQSPYSTQVCPFS